MALNIGELVGFIRADDRGMRRGLDDAELRMRGFQRDVTGRLRTLDGRFATTGELIAAGLRDGTDEGRRFNFQLGRIISVGRGLVGVAGTLGKMGLLIGAAVPVAGALVATLSQIAPAAAVGVSALLAVKLATTTLKLAMHGVEDAAKAALDPDNPEAYAEAVKKLSPEAKKFTDALRKMAPQLVELRKQVQDRVFAGLNVEMERTAKAVAPALRKAFERTGDSLNRMAKDVAKSARDLSDRGIFGQALDSATKSLENVEKVPGRITTSLGLLAAAAGPSLERLAKKADEVSARILDSLTESFESGRLERAIDGAIDAFAQLGRIGKNVFKGIGNIIGGVTDEAGSLFFILERISEGFERFTASNEFQSVLQELVKTAEELVDQVLPLLREAFNQLAPVIKELGPPIRDFIREIGPELKPVLQELGPILRDLAVIFREQMPVAIEFVKGALKALTVVLGIVGWVLRNVIVPAVTWVADILNSKYVKAIATTSEETAHKIGEILRKFESFRSAVATVMWQIIGKLWGFISAIATFSQRIGTSIGEAIGDFRSLPGAVRAAVDSALRWIQGLPGRARNALGDLSRKLFPSGSSLVQGFINGIWSKLGEVANAAASIVGAARSYFPFSPAKEGPFSGKGWTLYSGQSVSEALAAGMASRADAVRSAAAGLMGAAHDAMAGVPLPGMAGGLPGGGFAAAGAPTGGVQTVRIVVDGPQEMTRLIRKIVQVDGRGSVQTAFG